MDERPRDPERTLHTVQGGALHPGLIIGDRYRLEERLGEGAMGEVWLAYDLKLCVEVALKRLHSHLLQDERRATMLRHEVRAARDVTSPNVCRIYDLVESEDGEMISMEYVDGWTLSDLLIDRGPLDLAEAADIASQILAGLGAIHQARLIHRDLKPANVMLTRSGRVVLMDFGVARWADATQQQSIAGTPAYMAPEQMRGGELDARCDIYAIGILLAEMSSAEALSTLDERRALWERLHLDPPQVPKGPWKALIQRCLAVDPERRFASTAECARAMEESLYRTGDLEEEESPYPGLSTFTEKDARFFFGRELEVEAGWKKLQRTPMVAVIGPSGVGKSSFVRAGLLPAQPDGWDCVVCSPGRSPMLSLAQALATRFVGDAEAVQQLLRFEDMDTVLQIIARWRRQHGHVLLVLDQFEELFTQNTEEEQARFAQLLGRMNLEADIHVLVSMRDDFFFLCHRYPELAPLFVDPLPLAPLSGDDLRRALVQPAQLSGYHFESATLVEEMLEPVSRERGALPLLAFAAARLWEHRSRTRGQLTQEAYEAIGGVEGALAQHAEKVMERIGAEREDLVREIFRNLVTAHRTRVAREREELLSVFDDRDAADAVLSELIDARLLISYELQDESGQDKREVEIIHESLLSAWPRLVRWQTQEADGAQLRDQFRQAAQLWEERSRSQDLLWSGTAYQEFSLWRDRYEGGLSDTEEAFAHSMVAHEVRQRRRRKIALSSVFVVLLIVLGVVSKLKLDADASATQADLEKRQAISMQFEKMAEEALGRDNSDALACAIAGLEQKDSRNLRLHALTALWEGPTAFLLPGMIEYDVSGGACFSPDGKWLVSGSPNAGIVAWPSDGSEAIPSIHDAQRVGGFSPDGTKLIVFRDTRDGSGRGGSTEISQISFPDGEVLWTAGFDSVGRVLLPPGEGDSFIVEIYGMDPVTTVSFERWGLDGESRSFLGTVPMRDDRQLLSAVSEDQEWIAWARGEEIWLSPSDALDSTRARRIATLGDEASTVGVSLSGKLVAASTNEGETSIWSRNESGDTELLLRRRLYGWFPWYMDFDSARGRLIAEVGSSTWIQRLNGPTSASGMELLPAYNYPTAPAFHPSLDWLARGSNTSSGRMYLYAMNGLYPFHLPPLEWEQTEWQFLTIGPHGHRCLVLDGADVFVVDLTKPDLEKRHIFTDPIRVINGRGFDPTGERVALGSFMGGARVISLDGSPPLPLEGAPFHTSAVGFSPSGRSIATGGGWNAREDQATIRIFDTNGALTQELGPCHDHGHGEQIRALIYLDETTLLSNCHSGLMIWDLDDGHARSISEDAALGSRVALSEHFIATRCSTGVALYERDSLVLRQLRFSSPGRIGAIGISPDERFVAVGEHGGNINVRYLDEETHHVLPKLPGSVADLWIDPTSKWILATTSAGELSYWPVPRGRPLIDRPLDEFLEILKAQTNIRVKVDLANAGRFDWSWNEFSGWESLPSWQEWNSDEYMLDPPWNPILPRN